jgi:pseudaminic acid biosynthesis-associated methylase
MSYKTEQESFWAGQFGKEYISRNQSKTYLAANVNFFSKALSAADPLLSCIEFGANVGMNLKALRVLFPNIELNGVEINSHAAKELRQLIGDENTSEQSILDFESNSTFDLTLVKGVLIHINPTELPIVYDKLYSASSRYILICEYYNPTAVTVPYRGHNDRLFKRDFAGELLERYKGLVLRDYGFAYHRDPKFPQDDINWFLLEKQSAIQG